MIYLDSAAIVKLVRSEPGSTELSDWLDTRSQAPLVSSALAEIEVSRTLRRNTPQALTGVPAVLGRVYRLEIDPVIRAMAAAYSDPNLRSPDAIHLATAQFIANERGNELEAFVTYDRRRLAAAEAVGLPTVSPGSN
ncbi:MAG: type II toxin-antitoxin system VapC family toxin [Kutzneria sp.]|nr:type II toxin-antitoxin system VapC family toxin [Kutzneria sp.]MBV9844385.1 type II toxin-antitoxin system VapC family toxin [Kutzneria sp.]